MNTHQPRKRFGQNFLRDTHYIDRIIDAIDAKSKDCMVEIGPGEGALTDRLLESLDRLHVVEIDRDLAARLQARGSEQLTLHEADALRFDFSTLASEEAPLRIVGNLPYNISTPLLFHLFATKAPIQDMHFMLQKEVVLRMAAEPNSKQYGRLSIMTQYQSAVTPLFVVPPGAFHPAPKVDSMVVRLEPRPYPVIADDSKRLAAIVQAAFSQRRKTLRKSLAGWVNPAQIEQLGIDPGLRAENVPVKDFVALSNLASD